MLDMHLHTMGHSSDSMLKPEELAVIAPAGGLTGYNIADHDQVWERHHQDAYREQFPDVFPNFGMEVSTDHGHMIVVGLESYIPGIRRAVQLRAEVEKRGGFMIVAHPFRHVFDPVTAMRKGGRPFDLTAEQAAELPVFKLVHAIEVANGCNTPRENEFAYEVARILGIGGTGGSDAHSNTGIGYYATGFERAVRTERELLEELHAGRFEAVHRTAQGRLVRFELGSVAATQEANAQAAAEVDARRD
ncbi:MAG: hypothetical protein FJ035_10685 [Chloroflexi bacterium]|nr:hypothetical protein [Chloroflexota bacterium]